MSVLAIDVGGTKLASAVVNVDGAISGRVISPTARGQSSATTMRGLLAQAERSLTLSMDDEACSAVDAIGIACGGPLDLARGRVLGPPNLPD